MDENSQNMSQDPARKKQRGKENYSRNSIKYSSISQVIEKTQPFQHLKLPNGQYWGQTRLGKAEGVGSCQFAKGAFYYGEWKNNTMHGIGIYFFNIGGYIKGEFKESKADGNCELCYQNGQLFQGYFREGKQHGVGLKIGRRGKEVVQYVNGVRVCLTEEPQIIENVNLKNLLPQVYAHNDRTVYGLQCDLTGLGIIAYTNGRVDMGWFQNGSLNGRGRIIFKSGDIYDGLLKNGVFHGAGFYLNYNSKQVTEGTFEKNQIVSIDQQLIQYPPRGDEEITVVDSRIIIKNVHLKTRQATRQYSDKKPTKVNKIQNLIQHMLYPIRQQKSEGQEEVLDNLLSLVQSPQQRKNLEQIISQVTSPQRIR